MARERPGGALARCATRSGRAPFLLCPGIRPDGGVAVSVRVRVCRSHARSVRLEEPARARSPALARAPSPRPPLPFRISGREGRVASCPGVPSALGDRQAAFAMAKSIVGAAAGAGAATAYLRPDVVTGYVFGSGPGLFSGSTTYSSEVKGELDRLAQMVRAPDDLARLREPNAGASFAQHLATFPAELVRPARSGPACAAPFPSPPSPRPITPPFPTPTPTFSASYAS